MRPDLPAVIKAKSGILATILERKYGFDDFNDWFFAGGARAPGQGLANWGDRTIIDGIMVNGTAKLIGWFAGVARRVQTGYIYHYAFTMIIGVFALLTSSGLLRGSRRSNMSPGFPILSLVTLAADRLRRGRARRRQRPEPGRGALDGARGLHPRASSSAFPCGRASTWPRAARCSSRSSRPGSRSST